jgi:hypothetical protein
VIRAAFIAALLLVTPQASGFERSAPGSQLKTGPESPRRSTLSTPPPSTSLTAPSVTTAPIRLFGPKIGKEEANTPAVIATASLLLWGSKAEAATVQTAPLVLVGWGPKPETPIPTEPIRLWGL